jgi:hypothetical protein
MSTFVKVVLSVAVIVVAIPGLIIEPGPLSEIAALAALGSIWGFDLPGESNE